MIHEAFLLEFTMGDINSEFAQFIARATEQDQKLMIKHMFDEREYPKDTSIRFPVRERSTIHFTGWTVKYKTEKFVDYGGRSLLDYTPEEIEQVNQWIRSRMLRSN
jgi:hypothetical protein